MGYWWIEKGQSWFRLYAAKERLGPVTVGYATVDSRRSLPGGCFPDCLKVEGSPNDELQVRRACRQYSSVEEIPEESLR